LDHSAGVRMRRTLHELTGRLLGGSYELLLGRRTYEIFATYWPHNGDQPIGETFNAS
jgi:dihydrofolate reductase